MTTPSPTDYQRLKLTELGYELKNFHPYGEKDRPLEWYAVEPFDHEPVRVGNFTGQRGVLSADAAWRMAYDHLTLNKEAFMSRLTKALFQAGSAHVSLVADGNISTDQEPHDVVFDAWRKRIYEAPR